jgi:hypothetical protein
MIRNIQSKNLINKEFGKEHWFLMLKIGLVGK